jgi:hypothetical protein
LRAYNARLEKAGMPVVSAKTSAKTSAPATTKKVTATSVKK